MPARSPTRLLLLASALAAPLACQSQAAPESGLAKRAANAAAEGDHAPASPRGEGDPPGPGASGSGGAEAPAKKATPAAAGGPPQADAVALVQGEAPGPDAPRVKLRLSLPEGTTYVVHTVGDIRYPMVQGHVGYAVEERLTLDQCRGEGADRSCRVTRRVTAVDAEGRSGKFVRAELAAVQGLSFRQRIRADGAAAGPTEIEGEGAAKLLGAHPDLTQTHQLYCLRFPTEPVAKGAKWQDTCRMRTRGAVTTRKVLWEVSEVEPDPAGGHKVELRYVGSYSEPDASGDGEGRSGTIQGALFFHTGRGEPHVMHGRLDVTVDPAAGMRTTTQASRTFGKVRREGGKETLVLTDGSPFPEGINTREPAAGKGP